MGPPGPAMLLPALLMLLAAGAGAEVEVLENVSPSCPKESTRFRHLRKYIYSYEAESSSGVPVVSDSSGVTKINCKVELEVPQLCSFILRTSQCTLKEVHGFSPEGKALLRNTKNSEEFSAAMSKYELRLATPEGKRVLLYPEKEEPTHILNIKRGIISAFLVPPETEEAKQVLYMDTVFGNCSSDLTVKTRKGNVATEMSIERNLEKCDHFKPMSTAVSPLALMKGKTDPLSTLISNSQSCQYTLDPKRKHVSEAICKEQHLFLPFSHNNKDGMMAQVTQTLKLEDTPKINSRFFDAGTEEVGLAFESTKSSSLPKQAEVIVKTLQELQKLHISEQNAQRARLFNKLVTELRGLDHEAVSALLPKLVKLSSPITFQALVQCGQPQCYTHILQWLKSEQASPLLIDVVTYLMALIPEPSAQRLREIFYTAKEQRSRATFYSLSHVINKYHETHPADTQSLLDIADYLLEQIRDGCTGSEEHTYLTLRVIGNTGGTLDQLTPRLTASLLECIKSTEPSLLIQKAAIQALRKMENKDEVREVLLQTFLDAAAPGDKRLAAYLMLMRDPSQSDISRITQLLPVEEDEQVRNFVASHIANILNSEELYVQNLKELVKETLKNSQLPTIMDFKKYSQNYQFSKSVSLPSLDPVSAKIEGNLIFDPHTYLPKESLLKTTLTVFGFAAADLFELGLEGKGFEPTLEAFFGKQGFFPDSVNKALYWVDGQVPNHVSTVLMDHFGYTKEDKREQDLVNGIMLSVQKLIKDLKSKEFPEARAYLRILGEELGFVKLHDLQFLGRLLLNGARTLQGIPQMIGEVLKKGSKNDLFLHYIFMDNAFEVPTGLGLQLQMSSSGVITPGILAGVKLRVADKMQAELVAKPSVSVEFVTNMGIAVPDFTRSGVQMNTNFFHETGLEAQVALHSGQLKFSIPAPERPVKLFSTSNTLHLISTTKAEAIPLPVENSKSWTTCKPFFTGLHYCASGAYSSASFYYPLIGDTRILRFELELKPTGEVEKYSASATYRLQEESDSLVDVLKFVTQAEGAKQTEATMTVRYNRQRMTLSTEMQIPDFDVDLGTVLRISDESSEEKMSYKLTLDMQNKKITEVTLTGHISCDKKEEGKIKGVISIPRLQAEARSETLAQWSPTKLLLQTDSSATAYGSTISQRLTWRYDEEKIEFEWNTGTNIDTKKAASNFPVELSDYPQRLHAYANGLMDHRVPQTDMTFRHMGSKLIVAANMWLEKAPMTLPSAQNLQDFLSGLRELSLRKMKFPDFHIPENFFLKSDGRVKYILNKDSVKIEIPLPFGGKSYKDLNLLDTIQTPLIYLPFLGLYQPVRVFQVPNFTIPELYELQVPLLGVLDLSTNIYSNLYNWSASYTGGNTSTDHLSLQARYHVKADSAVDLLSYSVQGSGETTYDYKNTITFSWDGSLHHKFLDSNVKFSHEEHVGNNPASKGLLTCSASSVWGPRMSASVHLDSKKKEHLYIKEVKIDGQLRVSSFYAKGDYGLSYQRDPTTGQRSGESSLRFNSTYLQGTNQITGRYEDGTVSITSSSDLQDGIIKNTASLKYENYELTLKSDTDGKYENFATSNKVDLTVSKQNALLRSEHKADYQSLRFFTLLSGSLNSQGLELNADMQGTDKSNSGAHKATLRIASDGMSTSATTNLKYNPLVLEHELNAALGLSGASVKLTTNGRFREHNAKFSLDGKAALTEVSLGSAYQAMILGVDSKNIFNFKINQEGLKLSNDMMGSYAEMKLDHTNSLNIAGLSLDFSSKLDNIYSADKFYKQTFILQLQPYSLVSTLNNDLKFNALDLTNSGKLRLKPLKLNVDGNIKGTYQNDEIKHIYTISYADLSASYKANTVAKVQDTEFSHRLNTDIAGLASAIDINTNYNSDSLHFSNVFHSAMAPFTVTIDARTNGNGKLALWGEHLGQLYSKLLLKAEPLALTFSHDYKGSTSHHLMSGKSISTGLDNKAGVLLTPAEQRGTWELKTQLNKNEYSHTFEAYNTKDKVSVELTGRGLADLTVLDSPIKVPFLLTEPVNVIDALEMRDTIDQPQEFTMVASVKYDKNQDVHTINLPFFNALPEHFEKSRVVLVTSLKTIQRELKQIDIDQFVRKYRIALNELSQQVNDYLNEVNWERQVSNAKEKLTAFAKNYNITENDLKIALDNAKINFNEKLQTYVIQFDQYIRDNYDLHDLKTAIAKIINRIIEKLKILNEHYQIHVNIVKTIHDLYLFLEKIDFNKIGNSTASWIQNIDAKYQIRVQIQEKLQQLKTQIQNIDLQHFAEKLKQQVEAIDVRVLLDQLRTTSPFQKIKQTIEYVEYCVRNLIEDFEVAEKINAFRAMVHKLIKMYEIDQHIQVLMNKSVQLAHKYKLKETVQKLSNVLQQIGIKDHFEKLVGFIDDTVIQLQALSFKRFIEELNRFLDMLVKKLRSFDYHQFVDQTNNKIREVTQRINEKIQALDLQQKAKALKLFVEDIKTVLSIHLENLKGTKITLFIDWLQEALNSPSLNYMKAKFQETLEDIRDQMYEMDLQQEVQQFLYLASQAYDTLVTYIIDWWNLVDKNLTDFARQHSIENWVRTLLDIAGSDYFFSEIKTPFGTMPFFKVGLNALQEATFPTPYFVVPLTDLKIPSVEINFKKLGDIKVPARFSTPEFTVVNTFLIPSFTVDLVEIKAKIIRIIDQMLNSELWWPVPEVYLRDLVGTDTILTRITLPDFHVPEITIPEFIIPNLDLKDFQVPDLRIPELQLPNISHTMEVPNFGKLHSVLKIQSPLFTLDANADLQNVTSVNEAGVMASVTAKGDSNLEVLKFDFQANAQLLYTKTNPLLVKKSLSFSSKYLKTEYKSEVLVSENAIEGKANTVAGFHTKKNTVELSHSLLIRINHQLTLDSNTKYFHKLNIPKLDFSSQADLHNEIKTLLEAQQIAWTSSGTGSWKWACPSFSDEGTHDSQVSFTVKGPLTSFDLSNKIHSKHLSVNQTLVYASDFLDLYQLEIQSQIESHHIGHSVLAAKGSARLGERKVEVTGHHDAHLDGKVSGTLKNSLFFSAQPFEMTASTLNEGNLKVSFPLKLTGKIDFLNNYALLLTPNTQQASWQASARFNQYKYNHNFSAGNNENSIEAHIGINGEASLDFLHIPLTIPEMTLPFTRLTVPQVQNFSLWEKTGLEEFLKTRKQAFDLNVKVRYKKNKDKHSILMPLDVFYGFINQKINSFNRRFEKVRHKALDFFTKSYNEAKIKFDKYKVYKSLNMQPRTFQIPGYTIPVVNIEVSPFTVEMLTSGSVIPEEISISNFTILDSGFHVPSHTLALPFLELPALHVPKNFLKFSLPEFKILNVPNYILIPTMGNITYDFSFKSSVITLNTNLGLYNQSDIVAHFLSSSSSVIDALQYKLEGTSSLTMKRGLKLATALSLSNQFVEGNHDSTISLTKKTMTTTASVTTKVKVQIPILRLNFKQEFNGNTKSKPSVSSSIYLKYDFNSTKLHSTATGTVGHNLRLESLTSYFSIELANEGNVEGSVLLQEYSGMIASEVSTYLNSKGTRSSVKLQGASKVDGIWNLEVKESFAGEATLQRIYAVWERSTKNHLQLQDPFSTSGEHTSKATVELSPWKMSALVQVHASQPNPFLDLSYFGQDVSLNVNTENQKVSWKSDIQIHSGSLQSDIQLSNDQKEARLDVAGAIEAYLQFLYNITPPVYGKSLWELLKLDATTSLDRKQHLRASTALVYTKNPRGYTFSVPVQELADKFVIPGLKLNNLNSVLVIPTFHVPFTDLQVPSYTLDFSEIKIYKKLSTSPFALHVPALPKVKFPEVDVLTKYSEPEDSSVPFFEITVPKTQLTVSRFTYPKSISRGAAVLDLNEMASKIADFQLPNITIPDQAIEIPSIRFSVPAGINIPSFGALTAHFGLASPLYNATWSAGLKNKDHIETFLESKCNSTLQFLEYDLNAVGTHKIEDGALVSKATGTFAHRDIRAEYTEDGKYQGLWDWKREVRLDVTSQAFTDVHLHYHTGDKNYYSAASPAIGTVAMDLEDNDDTIIYNFYYRPQSSPDKKLSIFKIELRHQYPESHKKFQVKVNWEEEAVSELLNSLKDNMPRATGALYNYIDRNHQEYTGLDLREAALKLRRSVQSTAEQTYQEAAVLVDVAGEALKLSRVTRGAVSTYQLWNDRAQNLCQELLDQEGQLNLQGLQNKMIDSLVGVTKKYTIAESVIDFFNNYLEGATFRLPGRADTYRMSELCTIIIREVGKVLSQVHSKLHSGLETLFCYFQDLMEKSELIKDLTIKSPFDSKRYKLTDVTLEYGKLLKSLSQKIQKLFHDLQSNTTTEMLGELQWYLHYVFQEIEGEINRLKEKTFDNLINDINPTINSYIQCVFRFLSLNFGKLNELVQKKLQEASQELEQIQQYIKAHLKESLDSGVLSWVAKYYELEEKIIDLIKKLVDVLEDFYSKYTINSAGFASQFSC
ncbi:apolipoprotein B-100 [Saccopteryx bilineata]|uniref:apolipoprotein B-100 n=1 Tax=Saccopteryx bilineata TaxID=59482 RepID=UPI00338DAFEA